MGKTNSSIVLNTTSKIWCMLKLNNIIYNKKSLNLVAIGFGDNQIQIIDLFLMEVHQIIKTEDEVYSLAQFKNDSKYLIYTLSDGKMKIHVLDGNKYRHLQTLKKPEELDKGELNKVITLSDGNLATAERGALSIWKSKLEKGVKKFEFFKEIITDDDTCQLLEVNPKILVCGIYSTKLINVYKKNGEDYILLEKIKNVESHGNNSNSMAKINDKLFCCGGKKGFIYIVSVEPVQVIQKIIVGESDFVYVGFLHNSNDGFIFTAFAHDIIQFEIINDEDGNFVELKKFDIIDTGVKNEAIITTNDGKFFYKKYNENSHDKSLLILENYKMRNLIVNLNYHLINI